MNFWNGLLIFVLGCMVGTFVGILIIAMCSAAASADRRIEKMALERYEREKAEDSQGS